MSDFKHIFGFKLCRSIVVACLLLTSTSIAQTADPISTGIFYGDQIFYEPSTPVIVDSVEARQQNINQLNLQRRRLERLIKRDTAAKSKISEKSSECQGICSKLKSGINDSKLKKSTCENKLQSSDLSAAERSGLEKSLKDANSNLKSLEAEHSAQAVLMKELKAESAVLETELTRAEELLKRYNDRLKEI